jgi:DNA-binding CsgD family transcriptional regulator
LFCVTITLGVMLGTLASTLPLFSSHSALQLAGALLTGLTSPYLLLLWGERYGSLETRSVVIYTALSYLLVAGFFPLVSLLPSLASAIVTALMPLASLAAYATLKKEHNTSPDASSCSSHTAAGTDTATDANSNVEDCRVLEELRPFLTSRMLFGFLAVMFIYGGSLAFHSSVDSNMSGQMLAQALPPLLLALGTLCVGLFISRETLSLGVAYRLTLLLIAAIFIPLALLGDSLTFLAAFFASIGVNAIEVVTWILLASMASRVSVPRFTVFAACNVVFHVGMAAGELGGILLKGQVLIFSLLSICVLVALAGFAFTDRDTMIRFRPPRPGELGAVATDLGAIRHAAEGIATSFNLSKREKEVFMLWSAGYGAKVIEEKLFISGSTVKTHIQHIYEKCGVHSRSEIIALLEERLSSTREYPAITNAPQSTRARL